MGCLVSSNKAAPLPSVATTPPNLTAAACSEAPTIIQEKVMIMDFVSDDPPEDEEVTGKRSPVPEARKRRESLLPPASEAATASTDPVAVQAPFCQPATRKAENRKRTGLSNVAKPTSMQTQIGLVTGMDFSLQCDFPALPGQVSPSFSRPVMPGEDMTRSGVLHGVKNSLSFRPICNDHPDESINYLPPGLQGEPQASLALTKQQQQQLTLLNTMSFSLGDGEEETESSCMETPKLVANTDTGGGDHVADVEKAEWETERKLKKNQSQGGLLQSEGLKKENTVLQLLSSESTCPGLFSGDHSICHLPAKPVTYSGICRATIAQEFHFSLEDILQQQLPCNIPDVIELAATTGTDRVEGLTASISMPNTYSFSSQNADAQSNTDAAGTSLPDIRTNYEK